MCCTAFHMIKLILTMYSIKQKTLFCHQFKVQQHGPWKHSLPQSQLNKNLLMSLIPLTNCRLKTANLHQCIGHTGTFKSLTQPEHTEKCTHPRHLQSKYQLFLQNSPFDLFIYLFIFCQLRNTQGSYFWYNSSTTSHTDVINILVNFMKFSTQS